MIRARISAVFAILFAAAAARAAVFEGRMEAAFPRVAPRSESPRGTHIITFDAAVPAAERRDAIEKAGGRIISELDLIDGVVAEFSGIQPSLVGSLLSLAAVEDVELNTYRRWIEAAPASVTAVPLPSVAGALGAARALGVPEIMGRAKKPAPAPAPEPKSKELPWGVERVKAPGAWVRTTGKGVRVCVIDTGVDGSHPDLAPNYAGGYNAVDPQEDQTDGHGHGTHVAGTIAAAINKKGVMGVAPEASIYGVKVLDGNGGGTIGTIIAGIDWAVNNGMHVVNMSLGGPSSRAMERAIKRAHKAGVTIVAAAGNDPDAPVSAPAVYAETIAVSASTKEDALASFSTTGQQIDFIAPGHEILSTWPGSRLAQLSGTSMACPHVAGLAALAYSLGAHDPESIRASLRKVAVPIEGLNGSQQGAGMIEAQRWVK